MRHVVYAISGCYREGLAVVAKSNTRTTDMDDFLKPRYEDYTQWLESGRIKYSSKVIPIKESLEHAQWILPTGQVLEILKNAETIALTRCVCRSHYQRCSNSVEVCLMLDKYGRIEIEKGDGREITLDEATSVLKKANEEGLVHLSLYRPDHQLYALCSCCPCCCHDLQLLMNYGQEVLVSHSDYVAETDMDQCVHCGDCADRCHFKARTFENGEMIYDPQKCYGCGLCATMCPADATAMVGL